jgi:hypothetical protein
MGWKSARKMHRALEGEDLHCCRLDAEMAEHRLIRRLLLAAGNEDPEIVDGEPRHGPEPHMIAGIERPRCLEAAVAQLLDAEAPSIA